LRIIIIIFGHQKYETILRLFTIHSVPVIKMAFCGNEKDEIVTSLACMALHDGDAEITADQINVLLAATNNTVAAYWPTLFAGMCKDDRIVEVMASGGAAPPAAGGGGGGAAAAGGDAPAAAAAAAPKEEEVDALEGGMDMFGGEGGGGDY
jgi:ribosomal protein L12E/L44/L45/RPP1/RPP2